MGVLAAERIYASCKAAEVELLNNLRFRVEEAHSEDTGVTARGETDLMSDEHLEASISGASS